MRETGDFVMELIGGLEPPTSCVTGRRSNQLNYRAMGSTISTANGIIRNLRELVKGMTLNFCKKSGIILI